MIYRRLAWIVCFSIFLLVSGCGEDEGSSPTDNRVEAEGEAARNVDSADSPESGSPSLGEAHVDLKASKNAEPVDEALIGHVSTTALYVRSGPGTANPVVGVLVRNDPVTLIGSQQVGRSTWWQIEAAGGYVDGWVSARFMEHGPPPRSASAAVGYGTRKTPSLVEGPFKYIGVSECRECHEDSTGAHPRGAVAVWQDQLHSQAYKSLSRDYTLEIARRVRNVDDPTTDWRCLKCHVTAFGAAPSQLASTYRDSDGVGCEVCHGPGSEYASVDHGPSNAERYELGFKKLTNLDERETLCRSCHNEASPTYKPFNVMAFSRDIRHWPDAEDQVYFAQATARAEESESRRESVQPVQPSKPDPRTESAADEARRQADVEAARATARADAERALLDEKRETQRIEAEDAAASELAAAEARAAEERRVAERAAAESAAKAALEAKKAEELAQRERQEQHAREAKQTARTGGPLDRFLADVDDEIILNQDGEKRSTVRFTHSTHSAPDYVIGIECQTCHHTQEGEDKPEACSSCHDVGGEADEKSLKSKATHTKSLGFPKSPGQEQVSCIGCHTAQNRLLDEGKRSGEEAPTKCSDCHEKKGS